MKQGKVYYNVNNSHIAALVWKIETWLLGDKDKGKNILPISILFNT